MRNSLFVSIATLLVGLAACNKDPAPTADGTAESAATTAPASPGATAASPGAAAQPQNSPRPAATAAAAPAPTTSASTSVANNGKSVGAAADTKGNSSVGVANTSGSGAIKTGPGGVEIKGKDGKVLKLPGAPQ